MSTEIVLQGQWSQDQVDLLKRTICKDATDDELKLFMHVCQRTGLDPFARQIYAVKRKDHKNGTQNMVIQTSIDGFRLAAARSGDYAGSDDPVLDDEREPTKATVTVYRMVQGQRCPFTASARWNEYYPGDGAPGFMWRKLPCVMLSKVAEALALRKAFPADLSGVYASEEMDQASPPPALAPAPSTSLPPKDGHNSGAPVSAKSVPISPIAPAADRPTRGSVGKEIMAVSTRIRLGENDRNQWILERYKCDAKSMTLEQMQDFLAELQKEVGA